LKWQIQKKIILQHAKKENAMKRVINFLGFVLLAVTIITGTSIVILLLTGLHIQVDQANNITDWELGFPSGISVQKHFSPVEKRFLNSEQDITIESSADGSPYLVKVKKSIIAGVEDMQITLFDNERNLLIIQGKEEADSFIFPIPPSVRLLTFEIIYKQNGEWRLYMMPTQKPTPAEKTGKYLASKR
jgi:hypothetical protein